jgi:hypothetical protein
MRKLEVLCTALVIAAWIVFIATAVNAEPKTGRVQDSASVILSVAYCPGADITACSIKRFRYDHSLEDCNLVAEAVTRQTSFAVSARCDFID